MASSTRISYPCHRPGRRPRRLPTGFAAAESAGPPGWPPAPWTSTHCPGCGSDHIHILLTCPVPHPPQWMQRSMTGAPPTECVRRSRCRGIGTTLRWPVGGGHVPWSQGTTVWIPHLGWIGRRRSSFRRHWADAVAGLYWGFRSRSGSSQIAWTSS